MLRRPRLARRQQRRSAVHGRRHRLQNIGGGSARKSRRERLWTPPAPRAQRCPPRKRRDEFVARSDSAIVGRYAVVLVTMLQRHRRATPVDAGAGTTTP